VVKGATARAVNKILGRSGKYFWQDESFDHWIRNGAEIERVRTYIERNPVKAGLTRRVDDGNGRVLIGRIGPTDA